MTDPGQTQPGESPAPPPASARPAAPAESPPPPIVIEIAVEPRPRRPRPSDDPWSHRRGEPRLFAFLWTIYLLVAVGGSLLWLSQSTVISTSTYGPAARIMLLVVAAGATVLWPMVRLSQSSPRGSSLRAALADIIVVLFPMQMILWPLVMLAQWPLGIVGALAIMCTLWVVLIGGIIALATSGPAVRASFDHGVGERAVWMALCVVLVAAAPSAALARRAVSGPDAGLPEWVPMLSPFTAVPALTGQGFSGPQRPLRAEQWRGLVFVAVPAVAAWGLAFLRAGANRRPSRDESGPGRGGLASVSGLD